MDKILALLPSQLENNIPVELQSKIHFLDLAAFLHGMAAMAAMATIAKLPFSVHAQQGLLSAIHTCTHYIDNK